MWYIPLLMVIVKHLLYAVNAYCKNFYLSIDIRRLISGYLPYLTRNFYKKDYYLQIYALSNYAEIKKEIRSFT